MALQPFKNGGRVRTTLSLQRTTLAGCLDKKVLLFVFCALMWCRNYGQQHSEDMSSANKVPSLKELRSNISPDINPLMEGTVVTSKERRVVSGMRSELIDPDTGEVQAMSSIHRIKQVDDADFVKVFSEGVKAMYGLTRTGMRVFQAILNEYQDTKMIGGFADAIYLHWFGDGLCGRDIGMSEKTFSRGLKELLLNKFIAPRSQNIYWVNPALFFKGDRIALIKEYRRNPSGNDDEQRQLQQVAN